MVYFWTLLPVLQIIFAIHAYRRGNTFWMFMILFFPGVGVVIYLFVEFLPSLKHDSVIQSVSSTISRRILPEREIQRLKDEVAMNNSVKNRMALADGYLLNGRAHEAVELLESCLEGVYKDDPDIIFKIAHAYFQENRLYDAMKKCTYLREHHGAFKQNEVTSLAAMLYEESGALDKAIMEYESILKISTGEEIRCRYALALKKIGKTPEAIKQFETILQNARISPGYYRSSERHWINIARKSVIGAAVNQHRQK